MADLTFEAFLWSLTQQESGGNYGALGVWLDMSYGRDRAYGRYQVMGNNVPSWTAKYYGRRLTPQQFLASKEAQDAVVRGRLQEYVKKYGYRGAASAWYSGNPNLHNSTRAQPGGPSIKGYVDSVMSRASTYKGGTGGFTTTGTGGGTPTVTPKLDRNELAEQYGLSAALINSSSELKKLFEQAVSGSWSAARFQAALKNSKWWKTQPDSLRKYITTKYTDPATWRQQSEAAGAKINRLAVQVGLGSLLSGGKPNNVLKQAVYNSLALGWSDERIKDWLGTKVTTHGDIMWGEAGDAFDKLHEVAYLNGMRYSTSWYKTQATNVVAGRSTLSTYEDEIRRQAAGRFTAYREQILAGQNVMDLASPYLKTVATLLELPESDIDLFNSHVSRAMTGKGTVPLWQFENEVRNDPLWRKTNNARESVMSVAHQVAKDFGMAY